MNTIMLKPTDQYGLYHIDARNLNQNDEMNNLSFDHHLVNDHWQQLLLDPVFFLFAFSSFLHLIHFFLILLSILLYWEVLTKKNFRRWCIEIKRPNFIYNNSVFDSDPFLRLPQTFEYSGFSFQIHFDGKNSYSRFHNVSITLFKYVDIRRILDLYNANPTSGICL
jgi:hypothetical protein